MGELSETIAPPMKRARRWRTVSFILLILSIALWHWPRGDARFIGQWDLTNYEDGNFAYIGPVQVIEFRRNGRAVFSIVGRGAPEMFPFPWRAESTRIRFGYRPPFRFPVLNDGYSRAMRWMHSAVEPSLREAGYEILSCAENDIWLLESGTRNVVYLHRQGTPRSDLAPDLVARLARQWHGRTVNAGQTSALFEKLRRLEESERGRK